MKNERTNELARKAIHYFATLIPILYYFLFGRKEAVIILGVLTFLITLGEILRMRVGFFKELFVKIFKPVIRQHEEQDNFTGATFVFWGALLTIFLFPKPIATAALLFLTIGDSTACLVGMSIGRVKLVSSRTLEGSLAFIVASILATFWIPGLAFNIKVAGAIAASLVELVHRRVDDNILIPLIGGIVMYVLTYPIPFPFR